MVKIFSGIVALMLAAAGVVAFQPTMGEDIPKTKEASDAPLFWYKRTGPNTYVPETGNPKNNSETGCSEPSGQICSKGFPSAVTNPSTIADSTSAQATVRRDD